MEETKSIPDIANISLPTNPQGISQMDLTQLHLRQAKAHSVPSNWWVEPGDGDNIKAINNETRATFEGTIEEFNSIFFRGV